MEKEDIQEGVDSFPFWYHRIALPYGIETPGKLPIIPSQYKLPEDLTGKRVLDIGAWDGYWSFEALRRGASEVVAIDDFSDYLGILGNEHRSAWETFDFCRSVLGYTEEKCKRIEMSVYDVDEKLGMFDVIFFFGTLYHLRYPLLALDRISALCKNELYIESAVLDDFSPYRGGIGKGYGGKQFVMEFYPTKEYGKNDTNWWCPTVYCLMAMTHAAGFKHVEGWKLVDNPDEISLCRGFVKGCKNKK